MAPRSERAAGKTKLKPVRPAGNPSLRMTQLSGRVHHKGDVAKKKTGNVSYVNKIS